MSFGYPSSNFQFYYLSYTFEKEVVVPFTLKKVSVNGQEVRDFTITGIEDSVQAYMGYQRRYAQYNKKITGQKDVLVTVRCDWQSGNEYVVSLDGIAENGKPVNLSARGISEDKFGYWNSAWNYYATIVLKENAGMKREQEPVHLKMALYSDRLTDPEREIRVVEYDPNQQARADGPFREIPSQVYHVNNWNDKELINSVEKDEASGQRIIRYLATTTLEIAFFAEGCNL